MEFSSVDIERYQTARSTFIRWLTDNRMYNTLGLVAQCTWGLTKDPQHIASVMLVPDQPPRITVNTQLLEHQEYMRYVFLHELRHIPQLAKMHTDEFLNSIPWPAFIDTPVKRKTTFRMFGNIAADMALNEDLRRLLGKEEFEKSITGIERLWDGLTGKPGAKLCVAKPEWEPDQSFVYYLLKLIEEADDPEKGPEGYKQMDDHNVEEGGGEALQETLRGILERAEQASKAWANKAGNTAADNDLTLTGNTVKDHVRDFIRRMKVKVNRLYEGTTERRYAFEQINRLWPTRGLPGHKKHVQKTSGLVVVLDTSGSVVCDPTTFEQLRGVTLELQRQQKVRAVYCCDVKLHKMTNTSKAVGGGGTMLEPYHMDEIRKDLGLKPEENLAVIYITDGDVSLENLRLNSTVDLHELILQRG